MDTNDPISGLSTMIFLLDGRTTRLDASAPYDLRGTRRDGTASALDTRKLRNGMHRLTAIALVGGRARIVYQADFRVSN